MNLIRKGINVEFRKKNYLFAKPKVMRFAVFVTETFITNAINLKMTNY